MLSACRRRLSTRLGYQWTETEFEVLPGGSIGQPDSERPLTICGDQWRPFRPYGDR
jgi:hypothetical protein